ncbi:unnamed protein product [Effrenium voratum]|uniref:J domain-containing protein n=1 Tax=Effrenium voratum TaxID=2562239 RepID=A0AA36J492_9DINO|nr:unnamed protein product [Effrenium voratum]
MGTQGGWGNEASMAAGMGTRSAVSEAPLAIGMGTRGWGNEASMAAGMGTRSAVSEAPLAIGMGTRGWGNEASMAAGMGTRSAVSEAPPAIGMGTRGWGNEAAPAIGMGTRGWGNEATLAVGMGTRSGVEAAAGMGTRSEAPMAIGMGTRSSYAEAPAFGIDAPVQSFAPASFAMEAVTVATGQAAGVPRQQGTTVDIVSCCSEGQAMGQGTMCHRPSAVSPPSPAAPSVSFSPAQASQTTREPFQQMTADEMLLWQVPKSRRAVQIASRPVYCGEDDWPPEAVPHSFRPSTSAQGPVPVPVREAQARSPAEEESEATCSDREPARGFQGTPASCLVSFSPAPRYDPLEAGRRKTVAAEALGVKKTAGRKTVTQAFRRRVLRHHPDKGGNTTDFQAINAAHKLLKSADDDRE